MGRSASEDTMDFGRPIADNRRYSRRRGRTYLTFSLTVGITVVMIAALLLVAGRFHFLPALPNPLATSTQDRSQPTVLKSVENLSRYEAAAGHYQLVVDIDKEARFLPSEVLGRRTLYVAAGAVGAFVNMNNAVVTVSDDRRTATITLPHAQLEDAVLDPKNTYTYAEQRGIFDRFADFFSSNPGNQQQINLLAAQKIHEAAGASGLIDRAEQNTTTMLKGFLGSLGFTTVTVTYT